MKPYTVSIDIDLPRDRVVELFDNSDNLYKWQTGLQSVEPLEGEPRQPGSTTRLTYTAGKRRIELIETIVTHDTPEQFDAHYSWSTGENTLSNRFVELGPDRTRWESTCAYTFRSISLKLMGLFFAGKFREQNQAFLENFKAFAEEGRDVRDAT